MAQILVRDMDAATVERLKAQAKRHGRSLQGEVKLILLEATTLSIQEAQAMSAQWQKRLVGRTRGDSTSMIRGDRQR